MVERNLAKVQTRVRFSYPAPNKLYKFLGYIDYAGILLGEDLAFQAIRIGSNPVTRSKFYADWY